VSIWTLLFVLVVAWFWFTRLGKVSRERAHDLVTNGALLVDVRTESEFAAGHVPGAINVPVADLSAKASALVAQGKPIVVYCASGVRSAMARRTLRAAGADVHDLGAMKRW
jgi:phage shock protein E